MNQLKQNVSETYHEIFAQALQAFERNGEGTESSQKHCKGFKTKKGFMSLHLYDYQSGVSCLMQEIALTSWRAEAKMPKRTVF